MIFGQNGRTADKKKIYTVPNLEVVSFADNDDVITSSSEIGARWDWDVLDNPFYE